MMSDEEVENARDLEHDQSINVVERASDTDMWFQSPSRSRMGQFRTDLDARYFRLPDTTLPADLFTPPVHSLDDKLFSGPITFQQPIETGIVEGSHRKFKLPGTVRSANKSTHLHQILGDVEEMMKVLLKDRELADTKFEISEINQQQNTETSTIINRLGMQVDNIDKNVEYISAAVRSLHSRVGEAQDEFHDSQYQAFQEQKHLILQTLRGIEHARDCENHEWYDQVLWPQGDPDATEEDGPRCIIM